MALAAVERDLRLISPIGVLTANSPLVSFESQELVRGSWPQVLLLVFGVRLDGLPFEWALEGVAITDGSVFSASSIASFVLASLPATTLVWGESELAPPRRSLPSRSRVEWSRHRCWSLYSRVWLLR